MNRFWDLETIDICEKEDWNLHDFQDSIYFNKKADVKPGCLLKNRTKLCQIITLFVKNESCIIELKMIQSFSKTTMTFLLSKGKQELLRPLGVQALWETATI